ncbi:MBL fold metallo-hydrolase [Garicola koreensis]|uniref:Ribonuclease BN (tRNA processing enzyme) n=1 Tax=Garicola koreensis TaxID=1262554 RepID=A0A7W5XK96_9MICC|nr:MBL fold metallo-hydrolase [Garicola koreensis]MBB3667307.1 ribonuclease BN (tRNA processing enzyme) [Garicola koreensis]
MRLTIIGCSGSFPGPNSPASCYLLSAEHQGRTWRIILDLGNGALGPLQQHIPLETIDMVCLSHLHPDHYMDLCGLHVAVRWRPDGWPAERIPVYGPAGTDQRLAAAYGMDPDPGMHQDFSFNTWTPRQPVTVGPFTITPVPVRHPVAEPYALRVDCAEDDGTVRTLTYSGDTDTCPGLTEAAQDADLFLCEAAYQDERDEHFEGIHLTGARAGEAAAEAQVKRLLLTHIPVWTDPQTLIHHARDSYEGHLSVAVSGVTYTV